MKYYAYISNSKLDMLFPQIPRPFLEDISGELSVNFGLLKATLKDKGLTPNRLSKLNAVAKYIEKYEDVGDMENPATYIKGVGNMHSTILCEGMALFCWCSANEKDLEQKHYLLLSGSSSHLIGMDTAEMVYTHSITNIVLNRLAGLRKSEDALEEKLICENGNYKQPGHDSYLEDIKHWASITSGPVQKYEYLARTLIFEKDGDSNVILATPIYIALAD